MADSRFKIHEIQAGLGLSGHRFAQLREDVRREVERQGLTTTTLATNDMRRNVQTLVDTIISRFQKRISSTDAKFVRNAVFRLIHLEKANLVRHRGSKRSIDVSHKDATAKLKRSKSEAESAEEVRPVAKSIPIPTPEFNIPAKLNDAVSSNQTAAVAASPSLDLTTDMCLTICEDENRLHPVMLNMSCIFTDVYDESQANNMFHRASYQTLCSSLREEGVIADPTRFKLWGWVNAGPSPGWWRIRANPSLRSCLLSQARFNESGCFSFVITQEHMPGLPAQEGFQTTTAKSAPSNDGATYASDNSEPFSPVTSTKRLHSCRSRRINEDKDDNKPFGPVTSTKHLRGRGNKHVGEDSKNSDSGSQTATAPPAASTERLAKRKTAHAAVHSNSSEKTETPTPATTTRRLRSDSLIPVISTRSIRSQGSERISAESNANSLAENPPHMSTTQHLRHRQSRRTVMESDSNESSADEKTDATFPVTSTRRLRKRNNNHIYVINSPRKKTKTPSDKEQYTPSPSPDDQFATDDESDDGGNNAVATIEELFLNIGHRSSYERLTEKAVQETCEFFMHTPRHMTSNDRIALRGIRSGLRPFQALGIFSMLQIEVDTRSGGILADEMGYGKTLQCLGKFICNRWLTIIYADIVQDRASERPRRHLAPDCEATQNGKRPRCPSQGQWPIQCPCVPGGVSRRFKPVPGPALALVPAKLVKNWQAECAKFLDTDNSRLNLKVCIGHRSATTDEKIGIKQGKEIMTPKGTKPSSDSSRFLIITSPTSYDNNVLYFLSTHESGFVSVPGKKRKEFRSQSIEQDVWGQIFRDEYHEEKRRETKGMSLCLQARTAHADAKIWFISGTPWSTSPRDLDGVFSVLYVKETWDMHARLRKADPQEYNKLITRYEAVLNRRTDVVGRMSDQEPVESMAELLEMIMIRRTPESRWFGKTMVELPPHTRTEIAVEFPVEYRPALQQMENLIKSSLQTITSAPGNPPKKPTLARFFERAYKIRAVTVFPALAALVLQHPFLDLTWGQFLREEYQFDENNPYVKNLPLLMSSSPKLESIFSIVAALDTMQYEFENGAVMEVPEKLVIAATNPLVCYLIVEALNLKFPEKQASLMTAQQNLEDRQDLVNAFQDDPKTKRPIRPRIIVGTMKLMGTGINLTRARQIIIVDPEYTSYAEQQAEGRITRIGQINHTTAHILICYDVEIERRIKRRHRKRAMMISGTVRSEGENSKLSQSALIN